jgi:molybdenum cofactor cytidylyltransferase
VKLAGLILAAGRSSRMGSPKALLTLGGETFLDRLIDAFHDCDPIVVVLGHERDAVLAGIRRAELARFVVNADYDRGQLSSLQCGLQALPPEVDAVVFTPVDHPNIDAATIGLVTAALDGSALVAVPRYQGRHGHPVAFGSALIPEFLALGPEAQARDVIHRHREETRYVDVGHAGILDDIDDPEAYARLLNTTS